MDINKFSGEVKYQSDDMVILASDNILHIEPVMIFEGLGILSSKHSGFYKLTDHQKRQFIDHVLDTMSKVIEMASVGENALLYLQEREKNEN